MKVAVVGTGLIGGSIGKGLLESGLAESVFGFDLDAETLQCALDGDFISEKLDVAEQGPEIDLWVLAVPPNAVSGWLQEIASVARPEASITDCTSVKQSLYSSLPESLTTQFVGGHPMAGHRSHGLEYARADLFEDAFWILTPESSNSESLKKVEQMVYALDAKPICMSPAEHDQHVAMLSHLPNMLANLLSGLGRDLQHEYVAGGSWQDLTRVAGGNPDLWKQILLHNRDDVVKALGELRNRLDAVEEAMKVGDEDALARWFSGQ
ncbi:MAG: prephenate dehydrogenase/arogenate dehydrogenase family protein [Armatimonadetes bacterium]|nr:prephenate dehydrogenase/arogenate dehydrogenase family protein [Armatimonadota bacterium]